MTRPRATRHGTRQPVRRFAMRTLVVLSVIAVAVHALVVEVIIGNLRGQASLDPAVSTLLTRQVTLALGGGLVLLWLVVLPLAHRLGRGLRAQTEELREQGAELRRLLEREQRTVQRLQEVDELRDRFLESVSHELRTPLTVVRGTLQTLALRGDEVPAAVRQDLLARAAAKSERLDELVLGLLEMNRTLDDEGDVAPVAIADVVRELRTQLPPRAVELDLEVSTLSTDRARFARALGHLLGNAIRHAPDDDTVVVRTRILDDRAVELRVEDHGPGIPDGMKHAVFDPFRQGDLNDAHAPGIGMGLAIVARYAADHGGRAWVSDRAGGGCCVHVLLPGVVPDDEHRTGQLRTLLAPAGSAQVRGPRRSPAPVPAHHHAR